MTAPEPAPAAPPPPEPGPDGTHEIPGDVLQVALDEAKAAQQAASQ